MESTCWALGRVRSVRVGERCGFTARAGLAAEKHRVSGEDPGGSWVSTCSLTTEWVSPAEKETVLRVRHCGSIQIVPNLVMSPSPVNIRLHHPEQRTDRVQHRRISADPPRRDVMGTSEPTPGPGGPRICVLQGKMKKQNKIKDFRQVFIHPHISPVQSTLHCICLGMKIWQQKQITSPK